jgi:hypothetical protein
MATKIITYPSKSVGDTWFATEANSLKDVINSNVSAFLDHTGSAEVHRAIDDSASGATDLWSGEKIQTELTAKAAVGHIHDDRYYTETEIDAMFATAGGGGATAFSDGAFEIQDDGDNTKVFVFEASAISTGTTRTVTMADQDVDLAPGGTFAAANGTNGVTVDGSGNISLTENLSENVQLGATGDSFTLLLGGNAVAVDSNVVTLIRSAGVTTTAGTIRLQGSATGHDIFLGGGGGVTQRLYILCDGFTGAPEGSLLKLANVGSGRVEYGLPEFASDQFAVLDDSDATKKVIIEPSAISTSTTRTIFMPDQDVDLTPGGTFAAASAAASDEFADDVFRIQDNSDATKEIAFQASAITTGTTRTITVPDQNIDLTPDQDFAKAQPRPVGGYVVEDGTDLTVTNGLTFFPVPSAWNGRTVSRVFIYTPTAGTGTGTTTIRFYNVTQATDLFTTSPSIDPTENGSDTAATAYVIDGTVTLATDDIIRIDCTAITGTAAAQGLTFTLEVE